MIRPSIVLCCFVSICLWACQQNTEDSNQEGAPQHPNILFILADDMGYGDPQSYNPQSKISTPNIDKIAKNGIRFTDAHSPGPWCVPSRYGLITGQYPYRIELNWRERALITPDQLTIAQLLKRNGYHTAMVGKWHLGFDSIDWNNIPPDQPFRGGPVDHGFDEFFGMHASLDIPPYFYIEGTRAVAAPTDTIADHQSADATTTISGAFWRTGDIAPGFRHVDVLPTFTQKAAAFLKEHHAQEPEIPFFLYVPLTAPHTPWVPTQAFQGSSQVGEYGDFMQQVDHTVGDLLHTLDSLGYTDNTLVIFTSDNGPVWFPEDEEKFDHQSTGALRGMKIDYWEGGHRVPFIVQWPGKIPAGVVRNDLLGFTDMLATFAAIVEDSTSLENVDSYNMLPALLDQKLSNPIRTDMIIGDNVARQGNWKFIRGGGEGSLSRTYGRNVQEAKQQSDELYHLGEDLSETQNLLIEQAEKARELKALLPQTP
uniref:Arylsulfatase n=1 Tax=Roseihalotalea indica TaxID=2867963 RepID=A0AA49GQT1_9BACT|nr:arylsulfatase [Tunicatimonas sp. TK19036]